MLRALFVIAIICYGCAKSAKGPFYALLFYLWIAYFRPEYWLWSDFFSQLNLSFIVGIGMVVATLLSSREKLRFGFGSVLMILFLGQSFLSTLLSPHPDYASAYFLDFLKSTVISLLLASLVNTEQRLRLVFVVIAASVGLEAVKQGWLQLLMNPGAQNNNEHAVFGDNNGVAIGMLMLSSILVGLARTAPTKREKLVTRFALIGVLYRAISTYSRGGFLSCGALALQYILRSNRRFVAIAGIALVVGIIAPVLPDEFWARMGTINQAQENLEATADADASIAGRLHFWAVAVEMAKDRPLIGVGHNAYNASYVEYDFSGGRFGGARSVHSSWFGVLAELGFPGLFLFVVLILRSFWTALRAQRLAKRYSELEHLASYALAIESSLIVFCVGGTFVIFQYTEMLWHMLGLSIAVDQLVRQRLAALETSSVPAAVTSAAAVTRPWRIPAPAQVATQRK